MKLPNARKFFGRMRNRIYGIFGRKICATASSLKEQNIKPPSGHHRRLPLEMECEIFKCLKLPIQQKFIWGMGRGIYEMFGHKLLTKTKRVCNPDRNSWNKGTTLTIVLSDRARSNNGPKRTNIFAENGFAISEKHSRVDSFPGTIIYYYEAGKFELVPRWMLSISFPQSDIALIFLLLRPILGMTKTNRSNTTSKNAPE